MNLVGDTYSNMVQSTVVCHWGVFPLSPVPVSHRVGDTEWDTLPTFLCMGLHRSAPQVHDQESTLPCLAKKVTTKHLCVKMFHEDANKQKQYHLTSMVLWLCKVQPASRGEARVHGTTVATMRSLSAGMILGTVCSTSRAKARYEL